MSDMNQTPKGERVHISIFGRRNSGKSSLINALTNQQLAIVSDVAGTTTDPVSKSMELLPIGPVVVTDTAGIDDVGELGQMRVEKTLRVLESTDVAVLMVESCSKPGEWEEEIVSRVKERNLPLIVCAGKTDLCPDWSHIKSWATQHSVVFLAVSSMDGTGILELKNTLGQIAPASLEEPALIGDLLSGGDIVVLVVPIDKAAPKGRLILPQVMTIRDILDHDAIAVTVKERELRSCLESLGKPPKLVVTDSQAFLKVDADTPKGTMMTSFSILMARYRGDLASFAAGAMALDDLKPGDKVLMSESCTHHQQADDIGRVQIPRWLRQAVGGELDFTFASGRDFPTDVADYKLIVQCGGCMVNRREMLYRQRIAQAAGVPMTNYGVILAKVHGILERALEPFPMINISPRTTRKTLKVKLQRLGG